MSQIYRRECEESHRPSYKSGNVGRHSGGVAWWVWGVRNSHVFFNDVAIAILPSHPDIRLFAICRLCLATSGVRVRVAQGGSMVEPIGELSVRIDSAYEANGMTFVQPSRYCGFRRLRTVVPVDCGSDSDLIADSIPMIADVAPVRAFTGSLGGVGVKLARLAIFPVVFAGLAVEGKSVVAVCTRGRGRSAMSGRHHLVQCSTGLGCPTKNSHGTAAVAVVDDFEQSRPAARSAAPAPSRRVSEARHGRGS